MPWWHECFLFFVIPAKAGIHVSAIGFRLKNCRNDVQGRTNAVVAWMPRNGDVQGRTNAVVAWMPRNGDVQGRTNAVVAWMPRNGDVQGWTNAVMAWMPRI
jgi:hypothetical protein